MIHKEETLPSRVVTWSSCYYSMRLRPPNLVGFEPVKLKDVCGVTLSICMSVSVVGVATLNVGLFLSEINRYVLREVHQEKHI